MNSPDGDIGAADVVIPVREASVGGLLLRPPGTWALYLFAHGAGAGMRHPFMEAAAQALAARGIATLRYEFPYMAAGRQRPDPRGTLIDTVRAAAAVALKLRPGVPLFVGGKSMGGRMTSTAAAEEPLAGVRGIVLYGFPLHRPGDESDARADHLLDVALPMLFLQGTRDRLAELDRVRHMCSTLGPRGTLRVIEGADHGFSVLKRSGRTEVEVQDEMADAVAGWMRWTTGPGNR